MSEHKKQEQQSNSSNEQVVLENDNPTSNEKNIDNADEIKSRIEEDINEVNEKEAEKDWALEFQTQNRCRKIGTF